ncbi:CBS domain-containing protein CBSX5 [Senna tora]|uniref:CBS domain-containing protein CBSX5 n=1 Tax=Senna tora TaxID=362788 RepID=A0A834SJB9_9FABA|nr:CBS domain-containing protein CBSX5 [Senna tora]
MTKKTKTALILPPSTPKHPLDSALPASPSLAAPGPQGFTDEVQSRGCRVVVVDDQEVLGVYDAEGVDGVAGILNWYDQVLYSFEHEIYGLQGREILQLAKEADDIHHANLTDAPAILLVLRRRRRSYFPSRRLAGLRRVVAAPDADVAIAEPSQNTERVGYGVGDRKGPKRRLAKA